MEKLLVIKPPAVKAKPEKRRNNEKRKEKSRDAARTRRCRESEHFNDLAKRLPLTEKEVEHLDKASIMRLSIAFLKIRKMLTLFPDVSDMIKREKNIDEPIFDAINRTEKEFDNLKPEHLALNALDGFLLILSGDGEITYVSENIHDFLGLHYIDLIGNPIWDFCHQCDADDIRDALHGRHLSKSELVNGTKDGQISVVQRKLFIRLKNTLTVRGRSVNIKSASYKLMKFVGHIAYDGDYRQLVTIVTPIPHPSNIEYPMGTKTFLTKHSMDMKFIYVDDKMKDLVGYLPEHLLTKSLYTLHHTEDSEGLLKNFVLLINRGQIQTGSYRFLARYGGYAWVVTQATIMYDKQKPQSVVCVNYVLSGIENENEIYSCAQLEACEKEQNYNTTVKSSNNKNVERNDQLINNNNYNNTETEKSVENIVNEQEKSEKIQSQQRGIIVEKQQQQDPQEEKELFRLSKTAVPVFAANSPVPSPTPPVPVPATTTVRRGISSTAKIFSRPEPATTKIFAPRTEDMNKGFLTFADDESGLTMLKDEPEDLTHLAPTAGDECIQIEESAPFFNDMFDDFVIPDLSCQSFLPDDISSLDSSQEDETKCASVVPRLSPVTSSSSSSSSSSSVSNVSSTQHDQHHLHQHQQQHHQLHNQHQPQSNNTVTTTASNNSNSSNSLTDPYINYRDELSEASNSPHLLSPSGIEKSPDTHSMPSLSSPHGSLPEDDLAFMTSLNMEDEMELRAPYISEEDLPLLVSDDLMWCAHQDTMNLAKELKHQQQLQQHDSSLAALLCKEKKDMHVPQLRTSNDQVVNPMDVIGFNKNGSEWQMTDLLHLNPSSIRPATVIAAAATVVPPSPVRNHHHHNATANLLTTTTTNCQQNNNNKRQIQIGDAETGHTTKRTKTTITVMNFQPAPVGGVTAASSSTQKQSTQTTSTSQTVQTPHLLHQLITAPQQPIHIKIVNNKQHEELSSATTTTGMPSSKAQSSSAPNSNSVLMNLLVSGCDDVPSSPPELLMNVDDRCLTTNFATKNFHTMNSHQDMESTTTLAQAIHNNPMICGGGKVIRSMTPVTDPPPPLEDGIWDDFEDQKYSDNNVF